MYTTGASGGGTATNEQTEHSVAAVGNASNDVWADVWVQFEGGFTRASQDAREKFSNFYDDEARTAINTGTDTVHGYGKVTVWNLGAGPDQAGGRTDRDPFAFDLKVDGEKVATLEPGQKWTMGEGVSTGTGKADGSPPDTDGGKQYAAEMDLNTASGTGLLGLIPGLLPGVGPLSSSQTTAAAIVVAVIIAGKVLG